MGNVGLSITVSTVLIFTLVFNYFLEASDSPECPFKRCKHRWGQQTIQYPTTSAVNPPGMTSHPWRWSMMSSIKAERSVRRLFWLLINRIFVIFKQIQIALSHIWRGSVEILCCVTVLHKEIQRLKGALCSYGKEICMRREVSSLTDVFLSKQTKKSWLNKLSKQTNLKGRHNFMLFFLFPSGGPCHLSCFK